MSAPYPALEAICSNSKIYMLEFHNVFVPLAKCIFPNFKMYLSKLQIVFVSRLQQVAALSPVLPSTGGQGHSQLSQARKSDSTVLFLFLKVTPEFCKSHPCKSDSTVLFLFEKSPLHLEKVIQAKVAAMFLVLKVIPCNSL